MSEQPRVAAAARYKEITAIATGAAKEMREFERKKAAELDELVASGRERTGAADQQRDWVVEEVEQRWNEAMQALFDERWMRVTPIPPADRSATAADAQTSVNSVQKAYFDLYQSIKSPRFSMRRKRGDPSG